jgi:molybdate transport system ATP-binding protein
VTLPDGFVLTASDTVDGEAFVAFPARRGRALPSPAGGQPAATPGQATVTGVARHGDNLRVQLAGGVGEAAADITPGSAGSCASRRGSACGPP